MAKKTPLELSRFYKESLGPILNKYDNIRVVRIIKDAYLLPNGNVKEDVDIVFEYTGDGKLNSFPWHLPKITENTKVSGIRIRVRTNTRSYTVAETEKLHVIEILLNNVERGVIAHLKFEYYLLDVSEHKKGFLYNELYYPMAFLASKGVETLDIRIHLPDATKPEFDTNFPPFISVIDDDKNVLLTSQENGIYGDFSGYITLKYKSTYFRPFWAFVIGASLSASIRLIQLLTIYIGDWWYLLIPILLAIAFYFGYLKFKQ